MKNISFIAATTLPPLAIIAAAILPYMAVAATGNMPPPMPGMLAGQATTPVATPATPPAFTRLPVATVPTDAADTLDAPSQTDTLYFTNPELKLTPHEREALAIAAKWKAGNSTRGVKPVAGADGTIRFLFGATQPSIVCAVLQVCDVELQPGETLNTLHVGDEARWLIEPAITGTGANEVQHLIIKPMDTGLETSLVVTTDRRTYHFRLRSHRSAFMPRVGFIYPEDAMAKWDALKKLEATNRSRQILPATGEYLGDLNFDYVVEGTNTTWTPVRVYNNGIKTIIEMPATLSQSEAPILLVVRKDGSLFTDEESVQVNYRQQGRRYIVDSVFEKAILVAGVGSSQDRVTIRRSK